MAQIIDDSKEKDYIIETDALEEIYTSSSVQTQTDRWKNLIRSFRSRFVDHSPTFIARAPGRVNVIGEHIDYCGLSVLPAAIEPDLLIAVWFKNPSKVNDESENERRKDRVTDVEVNNLNPNYQSERFIYDHSGHISLGKVGIWTDYIKSAISTTLSYLRKNSSEDELVIPESVKLLVDGTVPPGSGLSSSAALATASVLVAIRLHQLEPRKISKSLAASLAIATEQACGISVGGMDQTASVFGQPSKLLHIEFKPTTQVVPIPIPKRSKINFVIANSLVTSNKIDSAKRQYNLRVVECRLAARLLSKLLLPPTDKDDRSSGVAGSNNDNSSRGAPKIDTLRELVDIYSSSNLSSSNVESGGRSIVTISDCLESLIEKIDQVMDERDDELTIERSLKRLGIDLETFENEILKGLEVEPKDGKFKIFSRARHVLTESKRVYDFRDLLEEYTREDEDLRKDEVMRVEEEERYLKKMGELMDLSHQSCQSDHECSCSELDELISIARSNGSLGSRLTGAGWGGATVHLVKDEDTERLIGSMKENYYDLKGFKFLKNDRETKVEEIEEKVEGEDGSDEGIYFNQACFSTKPQGGACIFKNSNQFF